MRLLSSLLLSLPLSFCVFLGLSLSVQADGKPDVQINLSRQLDHHCDGSPEADDNGAPGDCILYRIEVENKGETVAREVKVQAHIPEYTILKRPFELLSGTGTVDTLLEQMDNGLRVIKTHLSELKPGRQNRVVLIYEVQML